MKWEDLNTQNRAELIRLYVRNGVTSLDRMKEHYNDFGEGGHLYQEGGDKNKWGMPYQQQQIEGPYLPDERTYLAPTLDTVTVKGSRPKWHKYIQPAEWKAFREGKRGFESVGQLKELAEHRRTGKSQFMYEMVPRIRYDNREMRDLKQRILNYQELFKNEQERYTKNVQNERRRHPIFLTDKEVDEMLENYNFLEKNLNQYKNDIATLNKHINDKYKSNSFNDQLYRYARRHFPNIYNLLTGNISDITTKKENEKLEFSGIGSDIFSLDHNVIRVKPNTKQSTALFNEFVETKNPSIHLAKDYKEGKIKTFGDSNIPVKNIYLFQGIEDGKFKAGPIDNFKDSTLVYPVRNIKKDFITPIKNISIDRDGDKNDYDFKRLVSYLNLQLPVIGYRQFKPENQQNIKLQRFNERVKSTEPQSAISVIDINDRRYPVKNLNASILDNKMIIANPSGGLMIGRFQDMTDTQLDSLNTYLQQHPSWVIRNDLGSFDQYRTNNPTLEEYLKQFYENPNPYDPNVYTVGTVTPNIGFPKINTKYVNGGFLYNSFGDGGKKKAKEYGLNYLRSREFPLWGNQSGGQNPHYSWDEFMDDNWLNDPKWHNVINNYRPQDSFQRRYETSNSLIPLFKEGGHLFADGDSPLTKAISNYISSGKSFDDILKENAMFVRNFSPEQIEYARNWYNTEKSKPRKRLDYSSLKINNGSVPGMIPETSDRITGNYAEDAAQRNYAYNYFQKQKEYQDWQRANQTPVLYNYDDLERHGTYKQRMNYAEGLDNAEKDRKINEGTVNMMFQLPFWVAAPEFMAAYTVADEAGRFAGDHDKTTSQWINQAMLGEGHNNNILGPVVLGGGLSGLKNIGKTAKGATKRAVESKIPQITPKNATIVNNLTSHVQGEEAVKMFKEYSGEPIPKGSINGEQLRKYVPEARERYGLVGNNNITDEEIAQALYKHSKELGENTAAVNTQNEPQLLFRGDTRPYTELRTNHHEAGGTEDNILGTLFLDRTGIGEGWGPDRYLYLANKDGEVMAPYRSGIETEEFSVLNPSFKNLYDTSGKGRVSNDQISYPYWKYDRKRRGVIEGNKIASDNFVDGTVNHLNAFVVRTPAVRDITNEVAVIAENPMVTPTPFEWLIPKEKRVGPNLRDIRLAQNKAVIQEAEKNGQGLLKSDRNSYWRGEEHENYDYFALPDFNARNAKHILPYDLRIPRDWGNPNIYKAVLPWFLGGGTTAATLYNKQ